MHYKVVLKHFQHMSHDKMWQNMTKQEKMYRKMTCSRYKKSDMDKFFVLWLLRLCLCLNIEICGIAGEDSFFEFTIVLLSPIMSSMRSLNEVTDPGVE